MDDSDKVRTMALNCLQQYKEEIKDDKCRDEVHRLTKRAARDIRFDQVGKQALFDQARRRCVCRVQLKGCESL